MRPVFGDMLISFGVVWYSGMRKWYAGFSLVVAAVGVVPGAKPCKSAGITRVYPGFPGIPAKYLGILPIWLFWGPNQLISTEFPRETREETRGVL